MLLRGVGGQPILIGPLLAIADGAEQTTGAAIAVRKDGTDVGAPTGTLSYVSGGVWQFIPSASEADCGIVGLILSKAGSASVPLNVVTTRLPVQTAGVLPAVAAAEAGGLATVDASNAVKVQSGTGENQISLASGLVTAGTVSDKTGYALSAAGVDSLWDELQAGHVTAGSYGADIADFLAATGPTEADIAAAVWEILLTDPAFDVVGAIGKAIADFLAATGPTEADIAAEVMVAINAETYGEPTAVPAATASLPVKIGWLFALARNKLPVTATGINLRNDGDTADIAATTHSEAAGTYTRNKWS